MKFLLTIIAVITFNLTAFAQQCSLPCIIHENVDCNPQLQCSSQYKESKGGNHQEKKHFSKEEIMSQKVAFFTQELELTPDEAEKFWPIYNENWEKLEKCRRAIGHNLKKLNEAIKSVPAKSDYEIKAIMKEYFSACQKELEAQSEIFEDLIKVIPVSKAAKTYSTEEKFRVMLIRQLKKK